ncbi:hypothetical protein SLEP1_g44500 [Rubroshorea leprosula]|uniref:Uncharacterized protein n=1 Tax=Rubroshorea leprosula TaxID=152421 RepID=A0AAV5LGV7_9ROSI|nr:hypothetical protein SLEP1_g44500 [Rubroshorea leprosula]
MATEETDAEGDNEEEDGVICIDSALLSPGSPSFRVLEKNRKMEIDNKVIEK